MRLTRLIPTLIFAATPLLSAGYTLAAEAAALAVGGVSQVESAAAGWRRSAIAYATSHGFAGGYERGSASLSVSAVAGEGLGMETDYAFSSRVHAADLESAEEVGARAGRRAVERLNPRKAKKGAFPVLFDQRVAGVESAAELVGVAQIEGHGAGIALVDELGGDRFQDHRIADLRRQPAGLLGGARGAPLDRRDTVGLEDAEGVFRG